MKAHVSGRIRALPDEIFDYLVEVSNLKTWVTNITDVIRADEALSLGVQFTTVYRYGHVTYQLVQQITRFEPNRRIAWRTVRGEMPVSFDLTITEGGEVSAIRYEQDAIPDGVVTQVSYLLLAPLMKIAVRRRLEFDLTRLTEAIETGSKIKKLA